jgi:hypothetical protein
MNPLRAEALPLQSREFTMEKSGSLSQQTRNTARPGAEIADRTNFKANLQQQMTADDAHYHAEKLALGGHEKHEGWIKAEEAAAEPGTAISAEARHAMIEVAAFYIAEKRGFAGNRCAEDWIRAQAEIEDILHRRR